MRKLWFVSLRNLLHLTLHFVCVAVLCSHRALVLREDQDSARVGGCQKPGVGMSSLDH